MKNIYKLILFVLIALFTFTSCEDVVNVTTPSNEVKLVVDAQLNNGKGPQTMKVMLSQTYFDNSAIPPAIGANIKVTDNEGRIYNFIQQLDKDNMPTIYYVWKPEKGESFGKIGAKYTLEISYQGETFKSVTEMKPVPKIDSLVYSFKDNSALPSTDAKKEKKGYRPEFFARDLTGNGDCYYIRGARYIKKENKWNNDNEQIAYDAAFQPGARADGLVFILPIRRSITNNLLQEGDSIRAEIYSITESHFDFLRAAGQEAQNQGLFATPPQTFQTNIVNVFASLHRSQKG
jgi:Domain of unknown function (DUF4249)